ncbi:MAG: sensor histidine kinase [Deltaproteobacteria bacterium]|nr:sensor histidine kinase [Deltaproteobacteria bacterium]
MWAQLTQVALRPHIQHRRIRAAARLMLGIRLPEGAACWLILLFFYSPLTVAEWAVHLNFLVYALANLVLFSRQRRQVLTGAWVWFDIAANLLPMAMAAHWSGGVYSPLIPIFVIKIASYGLIYGVDVGFQSLAATLLIALGLVAVEQLELVAVVPVEAVPLLVRQRLTLVFEGLIFGVTIGGGFRFFRILQDREQRLAVAAEEKDSLYRQSLQQQEHLRRLSQSMMQVSERTLRRVARELHDDLGQALTAVKMELGLIERELTAESPARAHVRESREQIGGVLQNVRNLAQLLRPAVLDDLGLVPAIRSYITRFSERTQIAIALEAPPAETRLPRPIEVALYRVLQEALTNVARHAAARHVSVRLQVDSEAAALVVHDDGRGFDVSAILQNPPPDHGMGLLGMRERVAIYRGTFTIDSSDRSGTEVALTIPLTAPIAETEEEYGEDPDLVG